ncbi:uncharacterized protein Z518_08121 [Rhinocladiella mackenziei CBS 650.93]|uniref:F-box domain-containing protein n=1 Tax=Rhinocladiella mackenziei CBS 650.93 TaxID=1442369 RepID=A0A0D2FJQ5_9EURO|nr:uncharacterized protein Z518_08121 [Rhinocladiella mackenziei CBS 650.93]KIX02182.1 hypothetical protein Z518_08121 [Rhinocladiella mackenziei CBS 650.93]
MAANSTWLYSLPNEILFSILSGFETQSLLPWAIVSRRFHSIILRILHFRLLLAAALPDCKLILEAYHPSRRDGDSSLLCTYLGTDGLGSKHEGEGSLYEECEGEQGRFAKLGALYSRFRPERSGVQRSIPLRRIASTGPSQSSSQPASSDPSQSNRDDAGDSADSKVIHILNLDPDELFVQFCAYPSLTRLGPTRRLFWTNFEIVQSGQGVMRVWKQWLQDRAQELWQQEQNPGVEMDRTSTTTIGADKNIIWTDYRKNVGLRVAVRDREGTCYGKDPCEFDDLPMSFSIEIQELVVRTTHLMLAVEAFMQEQDNRSGKALIFGNFAYAPSFPGT